MLGIGRGKKLRDKILKTVGGGNIEKKAEKLKNTTEMGRNG